MKKQPTMISVLGRIYTNMRNRVNGKSTRSPEKYLGMEICTRYEFYEFSLKDDGFKRLWAEWAMSGYKKKLKPSPDRIDVLKGYCLENIQWTTLSNNSFRAVQHLCVQEEESA